MVRCIPENDRLPHALYRAAQVRELDRITIEEFGISGRTLMERAGQAAFDLLRERWPDASDITLLCGIGNNGGDGYVLARLAMEQGYMVHLLQLGDPGRLKGDALACAEAYRDANGAVFPFTGLPAQTDVIVDGVFGTGLEREVAGRWRNALEAVNCHPAPVLALDVPSGLHSDTGAVLGVAVQADACITFIGLKQGMFTGQGPGHCGEIRFSALGVPAAIYARELPSARRLDWEQQSAQLAPRARTAHKGEFGHLLVIGGTPGYSGAARLAAEAAARTGAGLVSVATHPEHASLMNLNCPELMCHGVSTGRELAALLKKATVVAIGPGLGRGLWSRDLLGRALDSGLPMVVDADALNLLADDPLQREGWILTPHPGEAGRLLGKSAGEIQADRFAAAEQLQQRYGGVVVLKGAGSLITDARQLSPAVCSAGNPGMASGGMGDLLTGILGGLLAQGLAPADAACIGTCLHAAAADANACDGERGMLASDLLPGIRRLLNLPGNNRHQAR
ncbi:MAG: NAD(P)H-hydrate dehydratase [Gammaproteobacteria bacterium]|nr:NAD(P)H-hydrate dehydratase [Gammaproteobacteria bacterium]